MIAPQSEFIWDGKLHLGDEPGIHGAATFCGIQIELPSTIFRAFDSATDDDIVLRVTFEDVQTFSGYPGHLVELVRYMANPADPMKWMETVLDTQRLLSPNLSVDLKANLAGQTELKFFLGVRVRVDTTVPAGLYDDFIVVRLELQASNFKYYASFGFN